MIVREVKSKSVLSASKIYPWVINPYTGCQFGCFYCYACYMKRFSGHGESWGNFVDVKINAVELLSREVLRKKRDEDWMSGVCDPYQPLEEKYCLTRDCLKVLISHGWPVRIQTRSPLVLRDLDVIGDSQDCHVGMSIATADDSIRRIFEPRASEISKRMEAIRKIHEAGISTYVMIAPLLPGAEKLLPLLEDVVDYVYVDRMNYEHASFLYRQHSLEYYRTNSFFSEMKKTISGQCLEAEIPCHIFY